MAHTALLSLVFQPVHFILLGGVYSAASRGPTKESCWGQAASSCVTFRMCLCAPSSVHLVASVDGEEFTGLSPRLSP